MADGRSGIQVIDITNPENPQRVGSRVTPDYAQGVYVAGNYAYVADGYSGLVVIETPKSITDVNYIDSNTITVTIPAGFRPGVYNLYLTNPDGGHTMLHNAFTIVAEPTTEGLTTLW